jgi:indolepyruvate ferredoxin oxidoreductase alpha subunit
VLPPFNALDTCVCMGAGITIGLGMRHMLPPEQARRVVSVIGDSTFIHSGITGLVEMVYNPPSTGHLVIILDNGTTAMTGMQEHPGTGRSLDHHRAGKVIIEDLVRALGIHNIRVLDPTRDPAAFQRLVAESLASGELSLIVARRDCLLATSKIKSYEIAIQEACLG